MFTKIKTRRVFEEICEQVRQQLAAGVLRPGDKLPPERDLAATFNVSRSAVREAFRMLEMSGIVQMQKGTKGGAFICEGSADTMTQSLHDLMYLGRISVGNLAEARTLICSMVVELACERGTEADFALIQKNLDDYDRHTVQGNLQKRTETGMQFFRLVAAATRNEVLILLVDSLTEILAYVLDDIGPFDQPEVIVPIRRDILAHISDRDAVAAVEKTRRYMSIVHQRVTDPGVSSMAAPADQSITESN